jgi:YVTN family beta-propeller protein
MASEGGWDYLAVEPNSNKLFVSHSTHVNILNADTGDSIGIIPNTTGVHGIAFVPSLGKGFISCSKLNTVMVFDMKTDMEISQIKVGSNPDYIFYDETLKQIMVCKGKSNDVSFIDPVNLTVVNTVNVGCKPETAVMNNRGFLLVNIEDKNEVVVIDFEKKRVKVIGVLCQVLHPLVLL